MSLGDLYLKDPDAYVEGLKAIAERYQETSPIFDEKRDWLKKEGLLRPDGSIDIISVANYSHREKYRSDDMRLTDSKLIDKAQGVASNLTYNEEPQGSAKHMITELCHRLGKRTVTITKKVDGYLMRDLFGESRFLSWKEAMIYRLFGLLPEGKVLKTDAIDKAVKSALPAGYGRSVSPE